MKLVSFKSGNETRLGAYVNHTVYDLNQISPEIPDNMSDFLKDWENAFPKAEAALLNLKVDGIPVRDAELMAPIPEPHSCRDGYAFRQHVESARRNRGVPMIEEFDQFPIFYFTNHSSIQGPGPIFCMPDHFEKLDFELEIAIVINKKGRNIPAADAHNYIGGYMIMNDMSARTLQMEEMLLSLGPAKGKDFCTVIGPWLVTPDELSAYEIPAKAGHIGKRHQLEMTCKVNGKLLSRGNVADMDWTFSEIIERCAYGTDIFPGDVIGSGTVGTGCLLELNGTAKLYDPSYEARWLKPGDTVEMAIEELGVLKNVIIAEQSKFSLLAIKK